MEKDTSIALMMPGASSEATKGDGPDRQGAVHMIAERLANNPLQDVPSM